MSEDIRKVHKKNRELVNNLIDKINNQFKDNSFELVVKLDTSLSDEEIHKLGGLTIPLPINRIVYHGAYKLLDIDTYNLIKDKENNFYIDLELFTEILNRKFRYFLLFYTGEKFDIKKFNLGILTEWNKCDSFKIYLEKLKKLFTTDADKLFENIFLSDLNFFKLEDIIEMFKYITEIPESNLTFATDTIIKTNYKSEIINVDPYNKNLGKIDYLKGLNITKKIEKNLNNCKYTFFPKNISIDYDNLFFLKNENYYFLMQHLLFPTFRDSTC